MLGGFLEWPVENRFDESAQVRRIEECPLVALAVALECSVEPSADPGVRDREWLARRFDQGRCDGAFNQRVVILPSLSGGLSWGACADAQRLEGGEDPG